METEFKEIESTTVSIEGKFQTTHACFGQASFSFAFRLPGSRSEVSQEFAVPIANLSSIIRKQTTHFPEMRKSVQYPVRSTDNGASWQAIKTGLVYSWYMGICGDGKTLYTACSNPNEPFFTSPEKDGRNWTAYGGGTQKFSAEPFEMGYDASNHILYSASWGEGLLALKVRPSK